LAWNGKQKKTVQTNGTTDHRAYSRILLKRERDIVLLPILLLLDIFGNSVVKFRISDSRCSKY